MVCEVIDGPKILSRVSTFQKGFEVQAAATKSGIATSSFLLLNFLHHSVFNFHEFSSPFRDIYIIYSNSEHVNLSMGGRHMTLDGFVLEHFVGLKFCQNLFYWVQRFYIYFSERIRFLLFSIFYR